ncbi:Galactokinase [Streptomyces tendae]
MGEAVAGTVGERFRELYGAEPEGVWAAPGRVNLIGEHTDYNDGFVMPFALPHQAVAAVSRREDGVLRLHSADIDADPVELRVADLAPGSDKSWTAYPSGVVWALREAGHQAEATRPGVPSTTARLDVGPGRRTRAGAVIRGRTDDGYPLLLAELGEGVSSGWYSESLVVDDHRIFAESLAAALAAEPNIDVSAAGSGPAALRCLERAASEGRRFDVLLVDADLGGHVPGARPAVPVRDGNEDGLVDGISLVAGVRSGRGAAGRTDRRPRREGRPPPGGPRPGGRRLGMGGQGLLPVPAAQRDPGRAARQDAPATVLLTGVLRELTAARKHRTESEVLVESLTPREREVLRCMVAGLGRKAVAERLYLSPHTVRTHMQNVLGKLGVHSTLAAVALARRAGVGPADLTGDVVEQGGQLA